MLQKSSPAQSPWLAATHAPTVGFLFCNLLAVFLCSDFRKSICQKVVWAITDFQPHNIHSKYKTQDCRKSGRLHFEMRLDNCAQELAQLKQLLAIVHFQKCSRKTFYTIPRKFLIYIMGLKIWDCEFLFGRWNDFSKIGALENAEDEGRKKAHGWGVSPPATGSVQGCSFAAPILWYVLWFTMLLKYNVIFLCVD